MKPARPVAHPAPPVVLNAGCLLVPAHRKQPWQRREAGVLVIMHDSLGLIAAFAEKPQTPRHQDWFLHCPERLQTTIDQWVPNPRAIVDFGCGGGIKTLSLALRYPDAAVFGIDITGAFATAGKFAQNKLALPELPANLSFQTIVPGQSIDTICAPDVILSWSVLEHVNISLLPAVIADMVGCTDDKGIIITQIAPLFFSPFGSHLKNFCKEPWAHLLYAHHDFKKLVLAGQPKGKGPPKVGSARWMFGRYLELNKITYEELANYFSMASAKLVDSDINQVDTNIPERLSHAYKEDALRTNSIYLTHRP